MCAHDNEMVERKCLVSLLNVCFDADQVDWQWQPCGIPSRGSCTPKSLDGRSDERVAQATP